MKLPMLFQKLFASHCNFYKTTSLWFLFFLTGLYGPSYGQKTTKRAGTDKTASAYSTNKQVLAKGQQLFQQNCTACHNFLQKGIGPNLASVTLEAPAEWVKAFIRDAPDMISRGDARAHQLLEEYKQEMPAFKHLSNGDVDAIMAYIHSKRKETVFRAENRSLGAAITDPVPAKIPQSGLRLELEEVTTAPATDDKMPLARINKMQVVPGKKDRLFLEDLRGIMYEMDGKSLRVFMDFSKERPNFIHVPGLATGFGSYAFHPDFQNNGLLYTTHTEKANTAPADFAYADSIKVALQWVLTEWKLNDPAATTFSGSGRELFRVNMVTSIHGVQEITFNPMAKPGNPDYGMLYIGIGDGGATENGYYFLCKEKSYVWGKVLRIDPKGTNSKNGRYGIPAHNPYAGDNDPATLGEIFCRGFRNPNRIAWSPDGKMLISDIGQAQIEELNLGVAGADYGWPDREGTFLIDHQGRMDRVYALPANDAMYTYPAVQYDHDEGNAISAGFVYSGTAVPLLSGKYIFGDVLSGRVYYVENRDLQPNKQAVIQEFALQVAGKPATFRQLSNSSRTDLRFGVGLNQEFYLYTKADGKIYRITNCVPDK